MKILPILLLFLGIFIHSQTLSTQLDKRKLSLGEPATYTLRIEGLNSQNISIPQKNELLPFHFEVIRDSISQSSDIYERIIEFSILEEGNFKIPSYDIKVGEKNLKTISYDIEVINSSQKGEQIHDIMKNKGIKLSLTDYWLLYKNFILAGILIIAATLAILYFIRYSKAKHSSPAQITNTTLKRLDTLRKKKYIQNNDFRSFYVELIEITRDFLTKQYRIPANILLTDDSIFLMKKINSIPTETEQLLEQIFFRGDAAKFAKAYPEQEQMLIDLNDLTHIVKKSISDIEFENLRKEV